MKRLLIATSIILSILFNLMGTVGYASEPVWAIKLLSYDVSYEFNDTDSLMEFQLDLGSKLSQQNATVALYSGDNLLYIRVYNVPDHGKIEDSVVFRQQNSIMKMMISCNGKTKSYDIDATYTHSVKMPSITLNKYNVLVCEPREETTVALEADCGTGDENRTVTVCAAKNTMTMPMDLSDQNIVYVKTQSIGFDGILSDKFTCSSDDKKLYVYFIYDGEYSEYLIDTSRSNTWNKDTADWLDFGFEQSYSEVEGTTKEQYEQRRSEIPDEIRQITPYGGLNEKSFYVAKNGSDSNDGSMESPFFSVECALKALGNYQKPANIIIREGEYAVNHRLLLDNRICGYHDKPVIIKGYDNEKVVLKQGVSIKGSDFVPITSRTKKNRLKNIGARESVLEFSLDTVGVSGIDVRETKLLSDDIALTLSKWPKTGTVQTGGILLGGKYADMHNTVVSDNPNVKYYFDADEPYTWDVDCGVFFMGRLAHEFEVIDTPVKEADASERTITINSGSAYSQAVEGAKHVYCNVFEEMELPGEWCYDAKENKLYVYPTDNFKETTVCFANNTGSMVDVDGTENIVFDNIEFANMEKGVSVTNSSRILFQNCTIKNVLNNGLSFTNTTNCGIVNSKIVNIGNVGVMISGTEEVKDLYKSERMKNLAQDRNFVQNCTLSNAKRAGIGVYNGVGNIVSHNVISDMYRDGIIVSRAAENIVEYNEIFGGQADGIVDSGLIYCGGEMISRGNHFRNNYLHDPIKSAVGIYFDERMSDNMAYDNIIVNCPKGIFIHNGKDVSVYNNMILNDAVNGRQDEDDAYPIADWPTYYSGSGQGECVFQKEVISESGSVADFIKSDLYTSETWRQRYPKLFHHLENIMALKKKMADEGEAYTRGKGADDIENKVRASSGLYYENNLIAGKKEIYTTPSASWTIEKRNNYRYDSITEVGCRDLTQYDYSLRDDSPVYEDIPGFEDMFFDRMGICGTEKSRMNELYILSPGKDYVMTSEDLLLVWNTISGADGYRVEISPYLSFPEGSTRQYKVKVPHLKAPFSDMINGRYYVRVFADTHAKSYEKGSKEYTTFFSKGDKKYLSDIACTEYSINGKKIELTLKNNADVTDVALYLTKAAALDGRLEDVRMDSLTLKAYEEKSLEYAIDADGAWNLFAWDKNMRPLMDKLTLTQGATR